MADSTYVKKQDGLMTGQDMVDQASGGAVSRKDNGNKYFDWATKFELKKLDNTVPQVSTDSLGNVETRPTMASQAAGSYTSTAPADKTDNEIQAPVENAKLPKTRVKNIQNPKKAENKDVTEEKQFNLKPLEDNYASPTSLEDRDYSNVIVNVDNIPTEKPVVDTENKLSRLGRNNWNMQHGISSKFWNDEWRKGAEVENGARKTLLDAKANKDARADAMSERVKQMRRQQIAKAWDNTWKNADNGHYDNLPNGKFNNQAFSETLSKLASAYMAQDGNLDELPMYGQNRGGYKARSVAANKEMVSANEMFNLQKTLRDDLNSGRYYGRKAYYDGLINNIQKIFGNQGGNQADADKIRVQYLYLPQEEMNKFQEEYEKYMKSLASAASAAGKDQVAMRINAENNRGLEGLNDLFNGESGKFKLAGGNTVRESINQAEAELFQYGINVQANKLAFDTYVHNLVQRAIIDPEILDYAAEQAKQMALQRNYVYNTQSGGIQMIPSWSQLGGLATDSFYESYHNNPSYSHTYSSINIPKKIEDQSELGRKGTGPKDINVKRKR